MKTQTKTGTASKWTDRLAIRKAEAAVLWALSFAAFVGLFFVAEGWLDQLAWTGSCIIVFHLAAKGLDSLGELDRVEREEHV